MPAVDSLVSVIDAAGVVEPGAVFGTQVPETAPVPYVWVGRAAVRRLGNLDTSDDVFSISFDIEAIAETGRADTVADDIAELLSNIMPGNFGYGTVNSVKVDDQADDYQVKNESGDERIEVSAIAATLYLYRED